MFTNPAAKLLIFIGLLLAALGAIWEFGGRFLHFGRLPGDIVIEREDFKFFFPVMTSVLLSVIGSLILYLIRIFSRK